MAYKSNSQVVVELRPRLQPRVNEALKFLWQLRPKGPWDLVAIDPERGRVVAQTCETLSGGPDEPSGQAEDFIMRYNQPHEGRGPMNIYFGVNPVREPLSKKAKKTDVAAIEFLFGDLDPADGESGEDAKARYLKELKSFEPRATALIDSGNGLQPLWQLQQRIDLGESVDGEFAPTDQEIIDDVEGRCEALMLQLGSVAGTQNIDRILRVPGTVNHPNAKKREAGRVPCLAKLLWFDDTGYALDEFPPGEKKAAKKEKNRTTFDAFEDIAPDDPRLGKLNKKWIMLGFAGEGIERYKSRSDAVLAFICCCIRARVADAVIASCLMRWQIGEHIRDQCDVARALRRNIERAHEKVEDSKLFEMNEQHAVLQIAGKTRVATWGEDPEFPGYQSIKRFASFSDFKALYNKYTYVYKVDGKTVGRALGSWWINHTDRRQYDGGMRFMPERDEDVVGDTLNLWRGFAVAARKPDGKSGAAGCKLFLDHGLEVICSGNEQHFDYLIKREAVIAQQRTRSEVAVALRTEAEGTGKGFWERGLNRLYGVHAMQVQKPEHVIGKHNAHLETLLRLTADEALFALDPRHRNALFSLITEPTNDIEPKFVNAYAARNHINVDVISNAAHFIPVSDTARRFFVPTVSADRANDHEYFRNIDAQLNDGGYEALLYHLLHEIDLRGFNVRAVPKTAALLEQAAFSRKGVDRLVEAACNEARVPCQHEQWPGFSDCAGSNKQRGFDDFIDRNADHELSRMGALMVKRKLRDEWGCLTGRKTRRQIGRQKTHGILWPPLPVLREEFEAKFGKQRWLRFDLDEWQKAWEWE